MVVMWFLGSDTDIYVYRNTYIQTNRQTHIHTNTLPYMIYIHIYTNIQTHRHTETESGSAVTDI